MALCGTIPLDGCYPEEVGIIEVAPSQAIPPQQDFQAEVSVVAVPPGTVCPQGAIFAGFNDGRAAGMNPYVALDGLSIAVAPDTCPACTWNTRSGLFLTDIARAQFPSISSTIGDPELAVGPNDRVLYASMASRRPDGLSRDAMLVFRSDNCGANWSVSFVPLESPPSSDGLTIDRPSIFVDPSNRSRVIVGLSADDSHNYYSVSEDGGVTFSRTLFKMPVVLGVSSDTPWFTRYRTAAGSRVGAVFATVSTFSSSRAYYFTSTVDPTLPLSWTVPVLIEPPRRALDAWSGARIFGESPRGDQQPTIVTTPSAILVAFPAYYAGLDSQLIVVRSSKDGGQTWQIAYTSLDGQSPQSPRPILQHDASWPLLAVNDLDETDRRVFLGWYDTRDDPMTPGRRLGVYAASSRSGGSAWTVGSPQSLRGALPPFVPFVGAPNGYYGDYFGCTWVAPRNQPQAGKFICVWMESRIPNTTRLYSTAVSP